MSLARYAKRRDENEPEIMKGLRACGLQVRQQDFPDLLVRRRRDGELWVIEIQGITRYRKRSAEQLKLLEEWQIPIVKTLTEALAVCGISCGS